MAEKSPTQITVGSPTLSDWRPDRMDSRRKSKILEDTAAYPKSTRDSGEPFASGAVPMSRDEPLSPPTGQENGKPLTRWQRNKQHMRRYWYWYVPLALLILAVALIIMFLAIIPAIVQRIVDQTDLPVNSAMVVNPSPSSMVFSLSSSLKLPGGISARMSSVNLSLSGSTDHNTYANIIIPGRHLKGTTPITITNQTAALINIPSFTAFLRAATYGKNFTLDAQGHADVYLGVIKSSIKLDKSIETPGLQNLSGLSMSAAQIVLPAESDGTNLLGTAIIPNYSVMSFEMGNVTFNLLMAGMIVGSAALENVFLVPGNNTMALRGTLDLRTVIANLGPILASQESALKNGTVAISVSGNTTIYNGQHLTYYEEVLNSLVITTYLPLTTILNGTLSPLANSTNPALAKIGQLILQALKGKLPS